MTSEIKDQRSDLIREWSIYKNKQKVTDLQLMDQVILSQKKALAELRLESEELYQEAIQPDISLIPFFSKGPVATPPIEKYESPDGEYNDISRKWD